MVVAAVVVAVGILVGLSLGTGAQSTSVPLGGPAARTTAGGTGAAPLPGAVLRAVTTVPGSALAAVGVPSGVQGLTPVRGGHAALTGPGGEPELLYVGAEYCPYCAAERWAVVVALSHFGAFTGLRATHSSSVDVYPDTRTFSFYGSSYSSPFLDFMPVELETNQVVGGRYETLQRLTGAEQSVLDRLDTEPYTSEAGAIPFLDLGGRFVMVGSQYDPSVLRGLSLGRISAALSHPQSTVARAIDGAANTLISAISKVTGARPTG